MSRPPAADRETLQLGLSHSEVGHEGTRFYQFREQGRYVDSGVVEDNCKAVAGERFKRSRMCSTKDRTATIPSLGLAASACVARTVGSIVPRRPERFRNKFDVHPDLGRRLLATRLCGIIAFLGAWAPSPEGR